MTITGLYSQSFEFSFTRSLTLNASLRSSSPAAAPEPVASTDPVETFAQAPAEETPIADPAPPTSAPAVAAVDSVPEPRSISSRADALFKALDRDGSGAVSAEEFVGGSRDLLDARSVRRQDGYRGHHHQDRRSQVSDEQLTDLFAAVDANGDGSVDATELSTALDQARHGRHHDHGPRSVDGNESATAAPVDASAAAAQSGQAAAAPVEVSAPDSTGTSSPAVTAETGETKAAPAPGGAPVAFFSVATITVRIAIQQYAVVGVLADPPQGSSFTAAA